MLKIEGSLKNILIITVCMTTIIGCSSQDASLTPTIQVSGITQSPTLLAISSPTATEEVNLTSISQHFTEVNAPQLLIFNILDTLNGWGATEDKLVITNNGGTSWFDITPPGVTRLGYSSSVFFIDPLNGWVVIPADNFQDGTIAITTDGGQNWELLPVPFGGGDINFIDPSLGFILVGRGAAAGSSAVDIYSTNDGGHNWTAVYEMQAGMGDDVNSLPFSGQKSGLGVLDSMNLWVGGSIPMEGFVYLYASQNGGADWVKQNIVLPEGYASTMTVVLPPRFFDDSNGILPIRSYGTNTVYIFYHTSDGGVNWSPLEPLLSTGEICLVSPSDFIVWDGGPSLLSSHDGGLSWSSIATNVDVREILAKVDFVDANTGWMLTADASDHHLFYTTLDGGATWNPLIP
ncbi:MAG TPA: hypothetical protein VJZ78_01475 [Anaerolineales bacterium]|nr:hypothetical protein [Anaerolineales bacterium]